MIGKSTEEMQREHSLYKLLLGCAFVLLLVLLGFAFFDTHVGAYRDIEIARINALYNQGHQDGAK